KISFSVVLELFRRSLVPGTNWSAARADGAPANDAIATATIHRWVFPRVRPREASSTGVQCMGDLSRVEVRDGTRLAHAPWNLPRRRVTCPGGKPVFALRKQVRCAAASDSVSDPDEAEAGAAPVAQVDRQEHGGKGL